MQQVLSWSNPPYPLSLSLSRKQKEGWIHCHSVISKVLTASNLNPENSSLLENWQFFHRHIHLYNPIIQQFSVLLGTLRCGDHFVSPSWSCLRVFDRDRRVPWVFLACQYVMLYQRIGMILEKRIWSVSVFFFGMVQENWPTTWILATPILLARSYIKDNPM